MGHSYHYYVEKEYDADMFLKIVDDFGAIKTPLKEIGADIAGYRGYGEPSISSFGIVFNGAYADTNGIASEPFYLYPHVLDVFPHKEPAGKGTPVPKTLEGKYRLSVRTRDFAYDLAVQTCLIVAKRHFGESIQVMSDAEIYEWGRAKDLCQQHLGYGKDFDLDGSYGESPP